MHVLIVADGRSPITTRWIEALQALGLEVSLVSSYPCREPVGLVGFQVLPVAFSGAGGSQAGDAGGRSATGGLKRWLVARGRGVFQSLRYLLGPLTIPAYARRLSAVISEFKPDLVHALRIPFEGMLAAAARPTVPLAVSIWGNDLTLHGSASAGMQKRSIEVLRRANGLAADTARDIRMGRMWGFAADRPSLVVPGNGGIDLAEVRRVTIGNTDLLARQIPAGVPLVVNPRGLRPGYVRNEVFFEAIPLLLRQRPDVCFVCTSMAGQPQALAWVERLKISRAVRLLPYLPQPALWDLFQRAEIMTSISTHDGTPNTLLEAMACRCFPIAGDLESIREWITPGVNGLLVEATRPQSLAEAILLALDHPELRASAAELNLKLLEERAEIDRSRQSILEFYNRLFNG